MEAASKSVNNAASNATNGSAKRNSRSKHDHKPRLLLMGLKRYALSLYLPEVALLR